MIIVSTPNVTGKNVSTISLVSGSMVQSKHVAKENSSMDSEELVDYTQMLEEAREIAITRMMVKAANLGADAIVDVRFSTSLIMDDCTEVLVYGTAVKFVLEIY